MLQHTPSSKQAKTPQIPDDNFMAPIPARGHIGSHNSLKTTANNNIINNTSDDNAIIDTTLRKDTDNNPDVPEKENGPTLITPLGSQHSAIEVSTDSPNDSRSTSPSSSIEQSQAKMQAQIRTNAAAISLLELIQ